MHMHSARASYLAYARTGLTHALALHRAPRATLRPRARGWDSGVKVIINGMNVPPGARPGLGTRGSTPLPWLSQLVPGTQELTLVSTRERERETTPVGRRSVKGGGAPDGQAAREHSPYHGRDGSRGARSPLHPLTGAALYRGLARGMAGPGGVSPPRWSADVGTRRGELCLMP